MLKRVLFLLIITTLVLSVCCVFAKDVIGKVQTPAVQRQGVKTPEEWIQDRVTLLTKELGLTSDQQKKLKEMGIKYTEEINGIFRQANAQTKELRAKEHSEITAFLSKAQQKKYEEIVAKYTQEISGISAKANEQTRELRAKEYSEIMALLTKKQQEKYEGLRKRPWLP